MRRFLYLTLRLVSRYGHLIKRRFTKPGIWVLGALVATATVGIDTQQTVAYQLFAFLFCLVCFATLQFWFFKPRIDIKRSLPPYATAGEGFEYRIELCNRSKKPERGLRLLEDLSDPRPGFEEFSRGLRRRSEANGFIRRFSIWDKWQRMVAANQPADIAEQSLPELPPNRPVEIRPTVRPMRRGLIHLTGLTVARLDCFGLAKAFFTLQRPESLLVLPKRYQLPDLVLPGNRVYQHGGMTLAATLGESEEFVGLRDYRAGDPLKQIHWKSFARTGIPVVKEHQDEFFERHALVLDTFTEGVSLRAFEEAISIAASFAASVETQECLLDLLFVGSEAHCFTAGRGQLHTENMLEILAHTLPCVGKSFVDLQQAILERRPQLSGCILVLLGYDSTRTALVNELRASGLPIKVLIVGAEQATASVDPDVHFLELDRIGEDLAAL